MPDKNVKLSVEDRAKASAWLSRNEATRACPACGYPEWSVAEELAFAPLFSVRGDIVLDRGYPAVVVLCGRCKFFRLHSAIAMGLVDKEVAKETKDAARIAEAQRGS
ncbi:MAG: hypothetical protein QOE68_4567 [Thermoanaerobaculia bacterium]|jgi:hypothetical protein|nr:hypothetical protein [Thermoanaerobaculia bacterium]